MQRARCGAGFAAGYGRVDDACGRDRRRPDVRQDVVGRQTSGPEHWVAEIQPLFRAPFAYGTRAYASVVLVFHRSDDVTSPAPQAGAGCNRGGLGFVVLTLGFAVLDIALDPVEALVEEE